MYDNTSRVIDVDINDILPNRFQPRIQFDEEKIIELSDSIKEHGIIQPIVVRTIGDKYEIIAGERRYKAAVLAGKETVPVIIRNLNDKESAEIALIENIQRKNLTPIEEALSYKKILDMGYITQDNLAQKMGKSQSSVANKIRLLNLTDEIQDALLENKISERHARSLLRLPKEQQNEMLNRIITERLTVRKTDEEIDKIRTRKFSENEKGEENMNNNISQMPNMASSNQDNQSFDIFGQMPQVNLNNQMPVPQMNAVQSADANFGMGAQPQVQPSPQPTSEMPTFDVNFGMGAQPQVQPSPQPASEMPTFDANFGMNVQPQVQPSPQPASEMPTFDANFGMGAQPQVQPSPQPASEMPTFDVNFGMGAQSQVQPSHQSASEMPTFDANFGMNVQPQVQPSPQPVQAQVEPEVPVTNPIIDSTVEQNKDMFNFTLPSIDNPNINEPVQPMPEPIIVTDYSKQYDPVMPASVSPNVSTVDFKEVIAAIRECSNKIEQYGFKIDVEEYDLANLYQVVFKIEK